MAFKYFCIKVVVIAYLLTFISILFINMKIKSGFINDIYTVYYNNFEINNEWEPLGKHIYLRYKAHYFHDKSVIRILAISKSQSEFDFTCSLHFSNKSNDYINLNASYKVLRLKKSEKYGAFAIDCIIPHGSLDLENYNNGFVYMFNHNESLRNMRPINVNFKNDIQKKSSTELVLCSKQYNLTHNDYEDIKYWIDFNLKIGYKKIVIFNNSIPYKKFHKLFQSYGSRLDVKSYSFLPHLYLEINKIK